MIFNKLRVCLTVHPVNNKRNISEPEFELNGQKVSNVNVATHLGIKRGKTISKTGEEMSTRISARLAEQHTACLSLDFMVKMALTRKHLYI